MLASKVERSVGQYIAPDSNGRIAEHDRPVAGTIAIISNWPAVARCDRGNQQPFNLRSGAAGPLRAGIIERG